MQYIIILGPCLSLPVPLHHHLLPLRLVPLRHLFPHQECSGSAAKAVELCANIRLYVFTMREQKLAETELRVILQQFAEAAGVSDSTGPATPAVPIQVLLINGAQAKNVFWYVPAGATIGTGATMVGTLLADASITISTTGTPPTPVLTTLNGRAIALTAGVTMANTLINVPAP